MELRWTSRRHRATASLVTTAVIAALALLPGSAAGSASCDLVAAPTGSDAASGTLSAPMRTARKLVGSLQQGQTGCLRGGIYGADNEVKIAVPGVTLTSYPGERALVEGRVYVPQGANGVVLSNLDLDGRNSANLPSPTINADDVVLSGSDITNHHTGICVSVGSPSWGRAHRTVIENNRIHDCGRLPATNLDHGIYVNSSDDAVIRGNYIYDNADRGIQLYADAQGTKVVGNVIDGNGQGVIFGGNGASASSNNVVEHNVITNSRIRDNIDSNWAAAVGKGNLAHDNCVGGGAYDDGDGGIKQGTSANLGFSATDNLIVVPDFANRAAGDFALPAASPCAAILAGAEVPAEDASSDPRNGAHVGPVTITTKTKRVREMRPVRVRGKARGAGAVTILIRRDGAWRSLGRDSTTGSGAYETTIRLPEPGTSRVKAEATGLRSSRSISLEVQ